MMDNSQEYKIAMKTQVGQLFTRFARTYQSLWHSGTPRETAELMAFWINELQRQGISPVQVEQFGSFVTDEPEFRNYPPKPVQFAQFVLNAEHRQNVGNSASNDVQVAASKLCSKWRMIYGNLFCAKDELSEVTDFWTKELMAQKVSTDDIKKAYFKIRNQARYRNYPPTLDSFVMTAKLVTLGIETNSIPGADEAYSLACNEKNPHPLVREARRRVGSYEIRTQASGAVRKAFERAYETVIQELCSGQIEINALESVSSVPVESTEDRSETLASTIEDILSNLNEIKR